jgi:hypothetical protein
MIRLFFLVITFQVTRSVQAKRDMEPRKINFLDTIPFVLCAFLEISPDLILLPPTA